MFESQSRRYTCQSPFFASPSVLFSSRLMRSMRSIFPLSSVGQGKTGYSEKNKMTKSSGYAAQILRESGGVLLLFTMVSPPRLTSIMTRGARDVAHEKLHGESQARRCKTQLFLFATLIFSL